MTDERTRSVVPRAADASTGLRLIAFFGGQVVSHPLPRAGEVVIGRGDDAHVRIEHATVSRRHATLLLGPDVRIVDHGSFNGTSIGGKKIPPNVPVPLALATIVELGETMVVVQVEGPGVVTGSRGAPSAPRADVSPAMQHLYRLIDNVAQSNITVIVRGETGAGKELVAEEIHRRSERAGRTLVKLNCAALPEQLLEGELFGYERGAFTGAQTAKPGLVEAASAGTLLLDEIGDMPLAMQVKLLRVVEHGEVMRLGALKPRPVDVRFLAATHRDLPEMVAAGTFRADLYYRINGITITIPPLRERQEEIVGLAEHFLSATCARIGREPPRLRRDAQSALLSYAWPGNLRELKNVMDRVALLARDAEVGADALGLPAGAGARAAASSAPAAGTSAPPPARSSGDLRGELDAFEKERIVRALEEAGGNQARAAQLLGLPLRTFVKRLTRYGLTRARRRDDG